MALDPGLLTKLRAFEAVGRNLSFTRAAQELQVTPTALSHHVRGLESLLGTALVQRLHRRIALTAAGEHLLAECARGLRILELGVDDVHRRSASNRSLTIKVAPFFSARWLIPRLSTFWATHPEIDVQLQHAYQPADFALDRADAGIAWGDGRWPGTAATRILTGELTPMCSPRLAAGLQSPLRPAELGRWPLFYEFDRQHWLDWFDAVDARPPGTARFVQVDDSHALRRIAIDGDGIALFFTGLSREDRDSGQLVALTPATVDPGAAYWFIRPTDRPRSPQLDLFQDWLADEVELDPLA